MIINEQLNEGLFYNKKVSYVHSLNFWTKFLCLLLLLPLSGFLASSRLLLIIGVISIALFILSKIGFRTFWDLTKLYIIPIVIGIVALELLFHEEGTLLQQLFNSLILSIRFAIFVYLGVLFATTTSPMEIPFGLMKVKIPHRFGIAVMIAFRMLPLISRKFQNVIDAQRARGARIEFSIQRLPSFLTQVIALITPVLHSTLETSVKFSETLISRGYNPNGRITIPPNKLKVMDGGLFLLSLMLLVLSIFKY